MFDLLKRPFFFICLITLVLGLAFSDLVFFRHNNHKNTQPPSESKSIAASVSSTTINNNHYTENSPKETITSTTINTPLKPNLNTSTKCDVYCSGCKECSEKIIASAPGSTICLSKDIDKSGIKKEGTCILFLGVNDRTLDCQNHKIIGPTYKLNTGGIIIAPYSLSTYPFSPRKTVEKENYYGSSRNTIKNCTITHTAHGISLIGESSNNTIINNHLTGNSIGIYSDSFVLDDGKSTIGPVFNLISNNIIDSNTYSGILLTGSSHNTVTNNIIKSNINTESQETGGWGIALNGSFKNIISDNTVNLNGIGILSFFSPENTIKSNKFCSNKKSDIQITVDKKMNPNIYSNNTCTITKGGENKNFCSKLCP